MLFVLMAEMFRLWSAGREEPMLAPSEKASDAVMALKAFLMGEVGELDSLLDLSLGFWP